jgi:hypothetical protein
MMHGRGKSDSAIVAVKPTNKVARPAAEQSAVEQTAAEPVEPRAETKGNADWQSTHWTLSRASVSQALERMRQTIAVGTRGRSRMRESCTYGSVRGALSNERPYRNRNGGFQRHESVHWFTDQYVYRLAIEARRGKIKRSGLQRKEI